VAVDEALALGADWTWARIRVLAALLRASLAGAPGHARGRASSLPLGWAGIPWAYHTASVLHRARRRGTRAPLRGSLTRSPLPVQGPPPTPAGARVGVPGVRLHDAGRTLCGIVAFSVAGAPAAAVRAHLAAAGVAVHTSKATSTLLDFQARGPLESEGVWADVYALCATTCGDGGGAKTLTMRQSWSARARVRIYALECTGA